MTVTTDQDTETFPGNDVATAFPFAVKSQQTADIQATHVADTAVETKLVQDTDFTVALNDDGTSTITFPISGSSFSTLATGESLVVKRLLALTQTLKLSNHGPYNAQAVETALDRNTQMVQQNVPDMPAGDDRLVYWDVNGEQQLSVTNTDLEAFLAGGISSNGDNFLGSVTALKLILSTGLIDGEFRHLIGYFAAGDTNAISTYKWVAASSATDDGGSVLIPDDTPATGRWILQNKGRINIVQFGAKVDGVTNDTTAINNAALYSPELYFPQGTTLGVGLSFPANADIDGAGLELAIIKQYDNSASMITQTSGGYIRGVTLDGDDLNALGGDQAVIELGGAKIKANVYIKNVSRFGIRMRDYLDADISECYFDEALGHGGTSGEAQHFVYNVGNLLSDFSVFKVDKCYFVDTPKTPVGKGPSGMFVSQSSASARCIITDNRFNNIGQNTAGNLSSAIDLYIDGLGSIVTGNIVEDWIYQGIKLGGAGEIICSDNIVLDPIDTSQGIGIGVTPHSNTATAHRGRVIVQGNIVKSAGESGIFVSGNSALGDVFEIIVADNNVADTGSGTGEAGILMSRCANYSVSGNIVRNAGLYGIRTELSDGVCSIKTNTIADCGDNAIRTIDEDTNVIMDVSDNIMSENTSASGTIQCMLRNCKSINVSNNTVVNTTSGKTGINIEGTTDRLTIGRNNFDLNAGTEYSVNVSALGSLADFFTDVTYPYTNAGTPNGVVTNAYSGQTIRNSSDNQMFMARAPGGTSWAQVT